MFVKPNPYLFAVVAMGTIHTHKETIRTWAGRSKRKPTLDHLLGCGGWRGHFDDLLDDGCGCDLNHLLRDGLGCGYLHDLLGHGDWLHNLDLFGVVHWHCNPARTSVSGHLLVALCSIHLLCKVHWHYTTAEASTSGRFTTGAPSGELIK